MTPKVHAEAFGEWIDTYQESTSLANPSTSAVTMFTAIILILIASTLCIFFSSTIHFFSLSIKTRLKGRPPLPPGSLGLPIIGDSFTFLSNPGSFITSRHARYGRIFKSNVFGTTVFLESPAGNKFLFSNEGKLVDITAPPSELRILGQNTMIFLASDFHRLARRHVLPFVQPSALEQYVPRIERHTRNHLAKYLQPSSETSADEDFQVPVVTLMRSLMYSIIADLVMSSDAAGTEQLHRLNALLLTGLFSIPINFPGSIYHRALKARVAILAILDKIIARRRVELAEGKASPTQDLLSYLLTEPDESGKLSKEEYIKDNIILFITAGYETTSSVTTMALRFISLYPDVYQRLKEEHDVIAKRKNDGDGLTTEDISEMKYTWWVIQETMRRQTAVRMAFREATQDFEHEGFTILKGWKLIWTSHFHMDPKYFEDPEKFDPTRFNGENEIVPYSYIPFASGPHTCLGKDFAKMEMIIVLYHVMRDYTFTLVNPDEPVLYDPFSPSQKSGTLMRIQKLGPPTT